MTGLKSLLQLKQVQNLTMTPQLQQAIRLLQLSTVELRQEIASNLEQNPMLEYSDDFMRGSMESLDALMETHRTESEVYDPFDNDSSINNTADISLATEVTLSYDGKNARDNLSSIDDKGRLAELPHIKELSAGLSNSRKSNSLSADEFSLYEGETVLSLRDHLTWQLNLSPLRGADRAIAEAIIDGIDDSGYLQESIADIQESVKKDGYEAGEDDVLAILKVVQHYDPLGVGSRSVQECLLAQLNALPPCTRYLDLAKTMVEKHLNLLSIRDYKQLCQKLGVKEHALKQVIALVKSLKPRPGESVIKEKSDYVIPDVLAYRNKDGAWGVELNPAAIPAIRLNKQYSMMVNLAKTEQDRQFFKSHLQDANWFLASLAKRNETLLKVAECIISHQQDFLNQGETAMHPMILSDIAAQVQLHESTVSRITTEKYIHTPRGTYELRYFFSSHVSTEGGGTASATAIRAMIKDLISKENPKKPLSDSALADLIQEQGIIVARRTIAKYRESLGILSSSQRKKIL